MIRFISKKITLTPRQTEVYDLLLTTMKPKEIAKKLYMSEKTCKNHIKEIYDRLNVKSRLELLAKKNIKRDFNELEIVEKIYKEELKRVQDVLFKIESYKKERCGDDGTRKDAGD